MTFLSRPHTHTHHKVMDDDDRENEGDLVMAAEFVTAQQCAFMKAHTNGEM